MTARFSVLLDACVLVPVIQADTLLHMAEIDLFRPLWSDQILRETRKALILVHPNIEATGAAESRIAAMERAFPDARIENWETLLETIELPDPNDRHVVAAALIGRADLIVTSNIKDFPTEQLSRFNIGVQSPDEFLLNQLDLAPRSVMAALERQARATHRPPLAVSDILTRLGNIGCTRFALAARQKLWMLRDQA